MQQIGGVISVESGEGARARVLELIRERYRAPLYQPQATPSDIAVRISPVQDNVIYVLDAPHHQLLFEILVDEWGAERFRREQVPDALLEGGETLHFAIDSAAQLALFQDAGSEVPALVRACFPIQAEGSRFEVQLSDLKLQPPATPLIPRWLVVAELVLFDTDKVESVDHGRFGLCNFLGPRPDGRAGETARPGRPFDETVGLCLRSAKRELKELAPERLQRLGSSGRRPLLRDLLDATVLSGAS